MRSLQLDHYRAATRSTIQYRRRGRNGMSSVVMDVLSVKAARTGSTSRPNPRSPRSLRTGLVWRMRSSGPRIRRMTCRARMTRSWWARAALDLLRRCCSPARVTRFSSSIHDVSERVDSRGGALGPGDASVKRLTARRSITRAGPGAHHGSTARQAPPRRRRCVRDGD